MASDSNLQLLGAEENFARVREFLRSTGYSATNICERLGVERLAMFEGLQPRTELWAQRDALNVLISLFALGERVTHADFDLIPTDVAASLGELGLIAEQQEYVLAPVAIGPVEGLYFVSDRWCSADGSPWTIADDAVYPAITPNTLKFLDTVPLAPCEALLDVGAGTGVGALLGAAQYAKHASAFDITARSTHFAQFNCRLNGLTNVTVGCGDLYEPAGEQTFDRIIAHPPYVPVLTKHWTFHDGGDDGEAITRRLIEGLPRYLRPGGLFHCYAMGSDREKPFEQRMRGWLGNSEPEFDVQFIVKNEMAPMQFAVQTVMKHEDANVSLGRWKTLFEQSKVRQLVFGAMTIRRAEDSRKTFTVRREAGLESGRAEAEWSMRVEGELASSGTAERVLQMRPRLSPAVELNVGHRVNEGAFVPVSYELKTEYPYASKLDIPGWAGVLLGRCTGGNTTQQLLDELKAEGYLKAQVPATDFAMLVASFISRGFVEVEEFAFPPRR